MLGYESPENQKDENVIHEAAGIREREGAENLAIVIKGSGEDYARRVLKIPRGSQRRENKEREGRK